MTPATAMIYAPASEQANLPLAYNSCRQMSTSRYRDNYHNCFVLTGQVQTLCFSTRNVNCKRSQNQLHGTHAQVYNYVEQIAALTYHVTNNRNDIEIT